MDLLIHKLEYAFYGCLAAAMRARLAAEVEESVEGGSG